MKEEFLNFRDLTTPKKPAKKPTSTVQAVYSTRGEYAHISLHPDLCSSIKVTAKDKVVISIQKEIGATFCLYKAAPEESGYTLHQYSKSQRLYLRFRHYGIFSQVKKSTELVVIEQFTSRSVARTVEIVKFKMPPGLIVNKPKVSESN